MEVDRIQKQDNNSDGSVGPEGADRRNNGIKNGRNEHNGKHVEEQKERGNPKKWRIRHKRIDFQPAKAAEKRQIENE